MSNHRTAMVIENAHNYSSEVFNGEHVNGDTFSTADVMYCRVNNQNITVSFKELSKTLNFF